MDIYRHAYALHKLDLHKAHLQSKNNNRYTMCSLETLGAWMAFSRYSSWSTKVGDHMAPIEWKQEERMLLHACMQYIFSLYALEISLIFWPKISPATGCIHMNARNPFSCFCDTLEFPSVNSSSTPFIFYISFIYWRQCPQHEFNEKTGQINLGCCRDRVWWPICSSSSGLSKAWALTWAPSSWCSLNFVDMRLGIHVRLGSKERLVFSNLKNLWNWSFIQTIIVK